MRCPLLPLNYAMLSDSDNGQKDDFKVAVTIVWNSKLHTMDVRAARMRAQTCVLVPHGLPNPARTCYVYLPSYRPLLPPPPSPLPLGPSPPHRGIFHQLCQLAYAAGEDFKAGCKTPAQVYTVTDIFLAGPGQSQVNFYTGNIKLGSDNIPICFYFSTVDGHFVLEIDEKGSADNPKCPNVPDFTSCTPGVQKWSGYSGKNNCTSTGVVMSFHDH